MVETEREMGRGEREIGPVGLGPWDGWKVSQVVCERTQDGCG